MLAALSGWHEQHDAAAQALAQVDVLPAHAVIEAYSVLTRLPGGLAVPARQAADALTRRFGQPPLRLTKAARRTLLATLADAGVQGGASYDALVGLEANAHGRLLLTLDRRAQETYARLGVAFRSL